MRKTRKCAFCGKEHKMVPFVPDSVIHPELSHLNKEYLLPSGMGRTEAINKRIKEAGITRKIRDDQAKFLAFLCTSDRETMLRIYNEGRWQAMGGNYVSIPCAGDGSVSSETGWDGRKKDEEDENFRLRCWLHAAKTVKTSQKVQTKRKGYGMK